ncbi:MAG: prepilin peptidase [Thermoguttaceae bacterium]
MNTHIRSSLPFVFGVVAVVAAACGLFVWEVQWQMLATNLQGEWCTAPIVRYGVHLVLLALLFAATITDFRAMIIPDSITIPGTLLGITLATLMPLSALPVSEIRFVNVAGIEMALLGGGLLHVTSPEMAGDMSSPAHVACALAIWWMAIFAMLDRVWYTRLKFRYAAAIFWRYLRRSPRTLPLIALGVVGSFVIVPLMMSPVRAVPLFSSLVGMATGAGMIWGVRIVGSLAMRREAMGFGDVTLMGMIGAFLGWQPCVAIFFLAPFAGLAFAVVRSTFRFEREIPYGPFLCAATVAVIIFWRGVWSHLEPLVSLGIVLPLTLVTCLLLLGVILRAWRAVVE